MGSTRCSCRWSRSITDHTLCDTVYPKVALPEVNGEVDCQIVSAQSPLTERIEFHTHLHADGMMQMRPTKKVMVAAGTTIRFEPGALHLMFFNVNKRLIDGQTEPLQLNTDNCGSHSLTLNIRSVLRPMMDHS